MCIYVSIYVCLFAAKPSVLLQRAAPMSRSKKRPQIFLTNKVLIRKYIYIHTYIPNAHSPCHLQGQQSAGRRKYKPENKMHFLMKQRLSNSTLRTCDTGGTRKRYYCSVHTTKVL